MAFLVLILSGIAGFIFFTQPLGSIFVGLPMCKSFDTEMSDFFQGENPLKRLKTSYGWNIFLGVAVSITAVILAATALDAYAWAVLLGYFGGGLVMFFIAKNSIKENAVENVNRELSESSFAKELKGDINEALDDLEQRIDKAITTGMRILSTERMDLQKELIDAKAMIDGFHPVIGDFVYNAMNAQIAELNEKLERAVVKSPDDPRFNDVYKNDNR